MRNSSNRARYSKYNAAAMFAAVFGIALTGLAQSSDMNMNFELYKQYEGHNNSIQISLLFRASAPQYTLILIFTLIAFLRSIIEFREERKNNSANFHSVAALFIGFIGVILSGNLLTSLIFYFISGFAALFALRNHKGIAFSKLAAIISVGMISLLISLVIMWKSSGSFSSELITDAIGRGYLSGPLLQAAQILLLIGVLSAASVFPFHSWVVDISGIEASEEENLLSLFYLPGVIIFSSAFSAMLDSTFYLIAFWIAAFSILYNLTLALRTPEFDKRIRYVALGQYGLIFISIVSGNTAAGFYLMAALAAARILLHRSFFLDKNNLSKNNGLNYWLILASSFMFAGVPLSAVYVGYVTILDKLNTLGSPVTGFALTGVTVLLVFTSSYLCLRNLLSIEQNKFKKIILPAWNRIYEYIGIVFLILILLSFVSSLNPFDLTTGWVMKLLGISFSSLPTSSFDNYLYFALIFAAYSVSAFAAFLSAKPKSIHETQQVYWFERSIDNAVSYLIDSGGYDKKNAIAIPAVVEKIIPRSLGDYASIVLFVVVLFYFILRNS